ncbi:hypothetical protein [Alteromonas gilva]|uniref:DUF4231 domain-containing protein n=1 Tax=Alteromonas gilva TaxID=2987522 RepID=A0ABT5KYV4_9ALTE|nr:hypothetical protein [Alteromonas gilva]MDC8829386.1 hypothetical protein [Alteromonas gilva]
MTTDDSNKTKGLIPPLGDQPTTPGEDFIVGHASFTPGDDSLLGGIMPTSMSGIGSSQATREIDPMVKKLVDIKQSEYSKKAILHKRLHYLFLTLGATLGIATPFLIPNDPTIAQFSSIAVVAIISFDQIFRPKEKWSLYSKATDLLQLQLFKMSGAYESDKEVIETILNTEAQILNTVPDLHEVMQQVKDSREKNA